MAANVALPLPVASPLGAYACAVTESTRYTGGASRVQLHRLCALPSRECGATMRRLPGRYWFKVALVTAVQALGTVLNSPGWNVVTNPSLDTGAASWRPVRNSTPATMSTTASAAAPQTQVIRDLRRERAAALRLREPGPGSAAQPGRSVSSSCQVAAWPSASPPTAGPASLPVPGRACALRCRAP